MSRLTHYLAVIEDGVELEIVVPEAQDITENDEYAAETYLDEEWNTRLAIETEVQRAEVALEEIDYRMAALENHRMILEHGVEAQQYSPQFAAAVQVTLEDYATLFGTDVGASLERYTEDDPGVYYHVALESLTEQLIKLDQLGKRIRANVYNFIVGEAVTTKRAKAAKGLQTKAEAGLKQLAGISHSGKVDISLKGLQGKLAVNGTLPTNVIAAVKKDQAAINELLQTYTPAALAYMKDASSTAKSAIKNLEMAEKMAGYKDMDTFAHRDPPETKLTPGITDGSALLGNHRLAFKPIEGKDAHARLRALAKRSKAKFVTSGKKPSNADSLSLSKTDAVALLNAVKAYAEIIEKGNQSVTRQMRGIKSDGALDYQYLINQGQRELKRYDRNKELTQLANFTRAYPKFIARVVSGTFGHAIDSARTTLQLAERITKALDKGGEKTTTDDE